MRLFVRYTNRDIPKSISKCNIEALTERHVLINLDTKEQDIEVVATEQRIDTSDQQRKRWYTLFFSPLWVCLLIALALRVWLIVHTHGVIDGDEALVGIQAERILHGDFPVYFYSIPYFGSLEAYLVALVFVIAGPSVWALHTEP